MFNEISLQTLKPVRAVQVLVVPNGTLPGFHFIGIIRVISR